MPWGSMTRSRFQRQAWSQAPAVLFAPRQGSPASSAHTGTVQRELVGVAAEVVLFGTAPVPKMYLVPSGVVTFQCSLGMVPTRSISQPGSLAMRHLVWAASIT